MPSQYNGASTGAQLDAAVQQAAILSVGPFATPADLVAAANLVIGRTYTVTTGVLGTSEQFQIVSAGTYASPDGVLVRNLTGAQAVSLRTEYASDDELNADPRKLTSGQWSVPSTGATGSYAALGATGINRTTAAGTYLIINVENGANYYHFGAKGDGTTDDTAAIQAAFNASPIVIQPYTAHTFKITASITPKGSTIVFGAGKGSPDTGYNGLYASMTSPIFAMGNGTSTTIRDITFFNVTAVNDGGPVELFNYSANCQHYNCAFVSNAAGYNTLDSVQTYRIGYYGCNLFKVNSGWVANGMNNSNVWLFSNCQMTGGSAGGVMNWGNSYNITVDTCVFEATLYGLRFGTDAGATSGECNGINITGNSWEQCSEPLRIGDQFACRAVRVVGNFFSNSLTTSIAARTSTLRLGRISGLTVKSNTFTPYTTEYLFDFYCESTATAVLQTISEGEITDNEYTTSGAGITWSGYYSANASYRNRLSKSLIFEYGPSDTTNQPTRIGEITQYTTGFVSPAALANTQIINTTLATGAYLEKLEVIRIDPSADFSGTLEIGYSANATYNVNVSLPTGTTWTNSGYSYYSDLTSLISQPYCVPSDVLLLRLFSGTGTGTVAIRLTYRR